MYSVVTKPLDWFSLRLARLSVHTGLAVEGQLAAAEELLQRPDFTGCNAKAPVDLEFHGKHAFRFTSQVISPWQRNNIVHGRLFVAGKQWQQQPTVLFLHGWNAELAYRTLFPYLARRLNSVGINAVIFELPYHSQRKPRGRGEVHNFISDDLLHVVAAAHQSMVDARSLIAWLRGQGCEQIGVWGISLGGWITGLLACVEQQLSFAVMLAPVVRMDRVVADLEFCKPLRRSLRGSIPKLDPMNLISYHPQLDPADILMVASEHDLFSPIATIQELRDHWGHPELWRIRHGHVSVMLSAVVMERVVGWIDAKARVR